MRMNAGPDDANKANDFQDKVIRQSKLTRDVPHLFRIIEPVVPFRKLFYPTLRVDDKDGSSSQGWQTLNLPINYPALGWSKYPTLIDALERIDLEIRRASQPTADKVVSEFSVNASYAFPVIDRRDSEPVVKVMEVSWNTFKLLKELQDMTDPEDPTKLLHGLLWFHDIIITQKKKSDDSRIPEKFNVKYVISSSKNNPFQGKFDVGLSKDDEKKAEIFKHSRKLGIFTEEDFAAIEMFSDEAELISLYTPNTAEEIMETLVNNPICLDAVRNGSLIFPNKEAYIRAFVDLEIEYGLLNPAAVSQKALSSPPVKTENKNPAKNDADLDPAKEVKADAKVKFDKKSEKSDDSNLDDDLPDYLKGLREKD